MMHISIHVVHTCKEPSPMTRDVSSLINDYCRMKDERLWGGCPGEGYAELNCTAPVLRVFLLSQLRVNMRDSLRLVT